MLPGKFLRERSRIFPSLIYPLFNDLKIRAKNGAEKKLKLGLTQLKT